MNANLEIFSEVLILPGLVYFWFQLGRFYVSQQAHDHKVIIVTNACLDHRQGLQIKDLVMRRVWRGGWWAALAVVAVVLDVLLCLDPLVLKPCNDHSVVEPALPLVIIILMTTITISTIITIITITIITIITNIIMITTCIFPLLSQFLSCTSSLSVTTRWLRLVNVVLKVFKNGMIMKNRIVFRKEFEVKICLITDWLITLELQ